MAGLRSGLLNLVFPILSIDISIVANTTIVFNKGKIRLKEPCARDRIDCISLFHHCTNSTKATVTRVIKCPIFQKNETI